MGGCAEERHVTRVPLWCTARGPLHTSGVPPPQLPGACPRSEGRGALWTRLSARQLGSHRHKHARQSEQRAERKNDKQPPHHHQTTHTHTHTSTYTQTHYTQTYKHQLEYTHTHIGHQLSTNTPTP